MDSPFTVLTCLLLPAVIIADSSSSTSSGYYPPPPSSAPYPGIAPNPPSLHEISPATPDYDPQTIHFEHHDSRFANAGGVPPPLFAPFGDTSLLHLPPDCANLQIIKNHLYTIIEPILIGIVGIVIFLVVKNVVLPHLYHFARTLDEDEEERSLNRDAALDSLTVPVLKALSKGVCLERLACQMGMKAKDYTLTNAVVRAIEDYGEEPELLVRIFSDAATGRQESCEPYVCKAKSLKKRRKIASPNAIQP